MQRAFTSRARASALSASKLRSVSLQQQRFAHKVPRFIRMMARQKLTAACRSSSSVSRADRLF